MKRIVCLFLCIVMLFGVMLCSCGNSTNDREKVIELLNKTQKKIEQYCDAMITAWEIGVDKDVFFENANDNKDKTFQVERIASVTGIESKTILDALVKEYGDNKKNAFKNPIYVKYVSICNDLNALDLLYSTTYEDSYLSVCYNVELVDLVFERTGAKAEIDNLFREINELKANVNSKYATGIDLVVEKLKELYSSGDDILSYLGDSDQIDTVLERVGDEKSKIAALKITSAARIDAI